MMTLKQSRRLQSIVLGTLAWTAALLLFFPIFWMVLTSFKTEIDAFATPPQFIFIPTLENYLHIQERSDYFHFAWNSVLISFTATALCMSSQLLCPLLERKVKKSLKIRLWVITPLTSATNMASAAMPTIQRPT